MGREKARLQDVEDAWDRKAQAENLRCSICSQIINYSDSEVYFTVEMCSYCAHIASKDD